MQYDGELRLPSHFLVPPPLIERASEQYIVGTGLRVFACSESQKIGGWVPGVGAGRQVLAVCWQVGG
jgi:hypothetical protein